MDKKQKKKIKISLPDIKHALDIFRSKNWILTIIFFLAAFFASVYVWWDCVQSEKPRQQIVEEFNESKDDFEQMSRKVSRAILQLQQRREEFENSKNYSDQRELFRNWKSKEEQPDRQDPESQETAPSQEPPTSQAPDSQIDAKPVQDPASAGLQTTNTGTVVQ